MVRTLGGNMQIGDLVTWKEQAHSGKEMDIGIVIDLFNGNRDFTSKRKLAWVKFTNGQHSHRERTLCAIEHLLLVEDIK